MTRLLHIDSSILGAGSVSCELTADLVAHWQARHPDLVVTHRDLAANPLGQFSPELLAARATPAGARTAEQARIVAESEAVLTEFLAADILVIGAPMYNFSVPSQLKSWIDHVAVAGRTFRYGPNGPEGLAGGRRVDIVVSRGGFYAADTPMGGMDFQERYLRGVFGFLGITDIHVVRAEGVAMGPESRAKAMTAAHAEIAAV